MENRTYLEITSLSASDLKRGWFSGYQTEAVVWIDPSSKQSTGVTSNGGCNVEWLEKMIFQLIHTDAVTQEGKLLTIEIHSQSSLGVNNLLGTANVPLAALAEDLQKEPNRTQTYQLVLPSGKRYGSVSFLGKIVGLMRPPMCYPQKFNSDEAYFNQSSLHTSCGMASNLNNTSWGSDSYQPALYPPLYSPSNPAIHAPAPCSEGMNPYPSVSSVAPYPSVPSMPYPLCASMGQHATAHWPYTPSIAHPYTAQSHHTQAFYPSPPLYPCPAYSTPVYPPPYPPAEYDYHVPHAAY